MIVDILLPILYGVLIIAGIVLIMVLVRLYEVISNFNEISTILSRRVKELDAAVTRAEIALENIAESIKGFFSSFSLVGIIKEMISKK